MCACWYIRSPLLAWWRWISESGRNAEQTGLAWSISNSQDLFLRIVHYSEKNRQHVIFFSPKQERLPGLMEFSTYHRNKIKLTSNKRGERPTLCKMDSAMSIGLSGCELESTRAEPGMRTVKDFNDHIFQIGGMSSTYSVTEDQPYSTKNRTPASDTLVLVVVPVSPLLQASYAKLCNVDEGIYDNLCYGNVPLPSGDWRIRWTRQHGEAQIRRKSW